MKDAFMMVTKFMDLTIIVCLCCAIRPIVIRSLFFSKILASEITVIVVC